MVMVKQIEILEKLMLPSTYSEISFYYLYLNLSLKGNRSILPTLIHLKNMATSSCSNFTWLVFFLSLWLDCLKKYLDSLAVSLSESLWLICSRRPSMADGVPWLFLLCFWAQWTSLSSLLLGCCYSPCKSHLCRNAEMSKPGTEAARLLTSRVLLALVIRLPGFVCRGLSVCHHLYSRHTAFKPGFYVNQL